jgi:hypothetical protein
MKDGTQRSLDELLANLPKDIAPPNLWPAVVRAVGRPPRQSRRIAFAAAAASACLASALTWAVLHGRPATRLSPPVTAARAPNFDEPRDPALIAARAQMEGAFRERLAQLDPATRSKIEASLLVIHRAHEDIRKALGAEPTNPLLAQLLASTWHDEFDLYDRVVQATQPTQSRT